MKKLRLILFLVVILLFSGDVYYNIYKQTNVFRSNPNNFCLFDRSCTIHIHPDWSECSSCPLDKVRYDFNDSKVIAINRAWHTFCSNSDAPLWYNSPMYFYLSQCSPQPSISYKGKDITGDLIKYLPPTIFEGGKYKHYVRCVKNTCQKVLE